MVVKDGARAQKNKKPARQPEMPDKAGLAARQCAARLLGAVVEKQTSLDGLTDNVNGHPNYMALDERDRSLVRAILATALRNHGTIEHAITRRLDRPLPENAVALKHLLHIAAAQIIYLDIPDHSAVDLAVTAANTDPRNRKYAGLVNALLRRISRGKERILANPVSPEQHVPEWFAAALNNVYGEEKSRAILQLHTISAPIDLTVKSDPQHWAQVLGGFVLPNGSVRLSEVDGAITSLPGFEDGEWWVQDVAASLPARLLGDIAGQRVADLCAAPGGKTAQLALMGADVTAIDISANRLRRLEGNFARLKLPVKTQVANLMQYEPEELFDAVLLDAPCSSTGTIRRHPDVVWTKTQQDIEKLAQVQHSLLERAINFVKPGGIILFANCSLMPEEGEDMARLAMQNEQLELLPIRPEECLGFESLITAQGFLRSTPADLVHENPRQAGMDGFFAARFQKKPV